MSDSTNPQNPNQSAIAEERGRLGRLYDTGKQIAPSLGVGVAGARLYHKGVDPLVTAATKKVGGLFARKSVEETVGAEAKAAFGGMRRNPFG